MQAGGPLGKRVKEAWEWDAVMEQVTSFEWTRLDLRWPERGGKGRKGEEREG